MKNELELKSISDDELLRRLSELLQNSRRVEAELIAHMAEVDARRLYAPRASSLFTYCTEILHMAEHEAYLRIKAARASREHPVLLEMLADGRLHLSGIVVLRPHLTEANREMLLGRAVHKTRRQIEELVAELHPKPDVPPTIRKVPERREKTQPTQTEEQVPEPVPQESEPLPMTPDTGEKAAAPPVPPATRPAVVEPLSKATYKIQFTASAALCDKLEQLQALMSLPGNSAGKTKDPKKNLEETDTSPSSRYIPAPVRRAVCERDENRCAFVDTTGRRCTETKRLEFHHLKPYGQGGDHGVANIELRCRTHNLYEAERDYGKEVMDRYRSSGSRVSEPAAIYTFSNRATFEEQHIR
jgi:5-methylcytosine-specific restriction endonuclease McrA